jgi:hypothetical protein
MLGAWPTRAKEVTPWTDAYGSRLVFQGAVGGSSVDPRSFGGFLMQRRSLVAALVVHTPLPATVTPMPVLVLVSV